MARTRFVDKGFQIAKIVFFCHPSRTKGKAGHPRVGDRKEGFKGNLYCLGGGRGGSFG